MLAAGFKTLFFTLTLAVYLPGLSLASGRQHSGCETQARVSAEADRQFKRGQSLLSAVQFSSLRFSSCDSDLVSHAWVGYANSLYALDEVVEAGLAIDEGLSAEDLDERAKGALAMLKTWMNQRPSQALSESQRHRWSLWEARESGDHFDELLKIKFPARAGDVPRLDPTENFIELHRKYLEAPQKNVWVAGLSSAVIPGAGQAYSGHWQTAAFSYFINALFLGATIEFIHRDQPWAAAASGTVFSITYTGNIISAVQGVQAWNSQSRSASEHALKGALLPELTF